MGNETDPKIITREEKIKRQEELRLQMQRLRDERNKRMQERIQLLKTINTQRVMNQSLPLNKNDKALEKSLNVSLKQTNSLLSKSKPISTFIINKTQTSTNGIPKVSNPKISITTKTHAPKSNKLKVSNKNNDINHDYFNITDGAEKPIASKLNLQDSANKIFNGKSVAPQITNRKCVDINTFKKPITNNTSQEKKNASNGKNSVPNKTSHFSTKFVPHKNSDKITNYQSVKNKQDIKFFETKNMMTFATLAKSSCNSKTYNAFNEKSKDNTNPTSTKKWSMATVERLSKPKILNKSILPKKNSSIDKKVVCVSQQNFHPKAENIKSNNHNVGLRRSLSTVHFKRLGTDEAKKCFKRTYSNGNLKRKEIEDELPADFPPNGYFLPIASERKKSVSFMTPLRKSSTPKAFLNTPKPSELRKRLNDWLQKRGKSLSTFHHLKCFDIETHKFPNSGTSNTVYDEEDKENIEVSDDDSFTENITGSVKDMATNWRQTNIQSPETSTISHLSPIDNRNSRILTELTPKPGPKSSINPLLIEALFDLHQLILEDYSWLQCAEWLRLIIRECSDKVKDVAAYWECRAALEEKRGDFVRTVDCFNNALQHGAQPSNIEESLDNLLDKFMKLNLDPSCENNIQTPRKDLINVKNVFKTSLIRFAIKKQNNDNDEKSKYIATPVRRSSRLSTVNGTSNTIKHSLQTNGDTAKIDTPNGRVSTADGKLKLVTPAKSAGRKHLVELCESLRDVQNDKKRTLIFVPNKALSFNDRI